MYRKVWKTNAIEMAICHRFDRFFNKNFIRVLIELYFM